MPNKKIESLRDFAVWAVGELDTLARNSDGKCQYCGVISQPHSPGCPIERGLRFLSRNQGRTRQRIAYPRQCRICGVEFTSKSALRGLCDQHRREHFQESQRAASRRYYQRNRDTRRGQQKESSA